MTVRELMDILTGMEPEGDVFVQFIKTNGTSELFAIDDVTTSNDTIYIESREVDASDR